MPVTLSSLSKEYIRVKVEATNAGQPVDPTGTAPSFALVDFATDAEPSSWDTGTWETDTGPPEIYYARLLVGPAGDVTPSDGKYHIWLKITSAPEVPVRRVGVLTVE